jgi:ATP synthase F1 gamma subunit
MASINEINFIRNRMGNIETLERQMTATAAISITERDRTTDILIGANKTYEALLEPATAIIQQTPGAQAAHPLLREPGDSRAVSAYLLMGTDRVLCGTHNEDIFFKVAKTKYPEDQLFVIGSQITDLAQSLRQTVTATFPSTSPEKTLTFADFAPVGTTLLTKYSAGEIHRVFVVYKQENGVQVHQVIPIPFSEFTTIFSGFRPTIEPTDAAILDWTLKHLVLYGIYKYFLTSAIQEFSARLKTASTAKIGAKQLHEELDIQQNTLRRARITEQIIELEDTKTQV